MQYFEEKIKLDLDLTFHHMLAFHLLLFCSFSGTANKVKGQKIGADSVIEQM